MPHHAEGTADAEGETTRHVTAAQHCDVCGKRTLHRLKKAGPVFVSEFCIECEAKKNAMKAPRH